MVSHTATYDSLGRQISAADAFGNDYKTVYDARNRPLTLTDPEDYVTEHAYDGLGNRIKEIRPEGVSVDYTYDWSSRLRVYKDAFGNETIWNL